MAEGGGGFEGREGGGSGWSGSSDREGCGRKEMETGYEIEGREDGNGGDKIVGEGDYLR